MGREARTEAEFPLMESLKTEYQQVVTALKTELTKPD